MKKEKRTRNWATIIYPRQSSEDKTECPDNWTEILEEMGVKAVASPLHDKDIAKKEDGTEQADGETVYKKPHRHIIFSFEGVKSLEQVKELADKIGGVHPIPVNSLYGQVRYLCHQDNPEKAQYSTLDVITFGGFEYKRYSSTKEDEEKETVGNMTAIMNLVMTQDLFEYSDLAEYLITEEPELFTTFRKNPYFFATYLKSKRDVMTKIMIANKNLQENVPEK